MNGCSIRDSIRSYSALYFVNTGKPGFTKFCGFTLHVSKVASSPALSPAFIACSMFPTYLHEFEKSWGRPGNEAISKAHSQTMRTVYFTVINLINSQEMDIVQYIHFLAY